MPDNRPRPLDRKRTLIAPVIIGSVVAVLIAASLLFKGSGSTQAPPPPPPAVTQPIATPAPLEVPPLPLGRREIIELARDQAAAYAAGVTPPPQAALIGRRFSLKLPFGCSGPEIGDGAEQAHFEYDAVKKTIKLVARAGDWATLPIIQSLADSGGIEDVEGFWLPRPWSYAETCPPHREGPAPATPTPADGQSLGLARVFRAQGSRLLRRDGRPYEFVRRIAKGEVPPLTASYQLILEGRIVGFGGDQAIRCWSEGSDHRPICLYGVEFDRVAFEDAQGKLLAEWRE
jgi:hypothetical protein